jgi:methionyl aminopeptidase
MCRCLSSIGQSIQSVAAGYGFNVVQEFCGHGTGKYLHMPPFVMHYMNKHKMPLVEGMVFTIEPILVEGGRHIKVWDDEWTAVTEDGGRAAQFEHEVLIHEGGAEILTVPC